MAIHHSMCSQERTTNRLWLSNPTSNLFQGSTNYRERGNALRRCPLLVRTTKLSLFDIIPLLLVSYHSSGFRTVSFVNITYTLDLWIRIRRRLISFIYRLRLWEISLGWESLDQVIVDPRLWPLLSIWLMLRQHRQALHRKQYTICISLL